MSRTTELVEDAADRAERLMSISKAAALLGRDRGTLQAWVKKGMPVARKGDTGSAHMVDLKEVVAWREEVVRREERERFRGDDPEDLAGGYGVKMSPSDLLKLENLKLTRLKVGQAAGILVPAMVPEAAQERAFGILRQAMMAIPERITRSMAGFPEDRKLAWRAEAQGYVRSGLREAAKSVREAMPMIRVDFAGLDDPDDAA